MKLIHGDCLDVLQTLPSNSVDAVVTDPPYGIGFRYGKAREIAADPQSYAAFLLPVIWECRRIAKPGAFFAVWQAALNFRHFWTWFGDDIHIYAACKNFVQLRKTPINYGFDPVVCWYQRGEPLRPTNWRRTLDFFVANTANMKTRADSKPHPCPRPLDQVKEIVDNFVIESGTVLDPFLGSGTTAVACQQTGRKCIGIEKEAAYLRIARRRKVVA